MKRMMKTFAMLALAAFQAPPPGVAPAPMALWRLDCGTILFNDISGFSDSFIYRPGQPRQLVGSCYLIRHGDRYMLWDTGLSAKITDAPVKLQGLTLSLHRTIVDQLKELGVRPDQIQIIGISHYHSDHLGQAALFPKAKLIIGKVDMDVLKAVPPRPGVEPALLRPWVSGGSPVVEATGDVDVFDDGSVIMLKTPGHTPGHHSLLVRLAGGAFILTGDAYHFQDQVVLRGVPSANDNRADTLASMDRLDRIARNLNARMIIAHDPEDIVKLPRFPQAAQ
jgi:glyoxylase-like metal-dependent hydrolase (beta-lactamase superfamily II)